MTAGNLPDGQRKVVSGDAAPMKLTGFAARCFSHWLIRDILVPFLITRATLTLVAWLGLQFLHPHLSGTKWEVASDGFGHQVTEHLSPTAHPFINMWSRWDGGWYLGIAKDGYSFTPGIQSNVAFFPLYPMLVRLVHYIVPLSSDAGWLLIGMVVSNSALIVALIYLYQLVLLDYDRRTAARTVLYLCVFPATLFLSAVYSESLFLAAVVSSFYYARVGRWFVAGCIAALVALCRSPGVLIIIPLAFEYLVQKHFQWRRLRADGLALILAPLAVAGHLTFLRWRFGDWHVMSKVETAPGWDRHLTMPWNTLWRALPGMHSFNGFHGAFEFFFTLALLALAIFGLFRLRLSYSLYAAVSLVFITSWGELRSAPRLGLVIFPIVIALALLGKNRLFNAAYLMSSSILALISMVVFSHWGWVS